ncbi:MAG: histidine phosphatase family protein [Cyclobacteriaceae bacterium]|nr:histidine phosphatase family protein [Cyclobacteriaceae bacterium]MCX7637192.1 histidine phosphatase family protein [Cyclobacteriaceae bacterium]MDW8331442.1 histidine phosphatase family protein [Cyclobacteriaceae bacterium]
MFRAAQNSAKLTFKKIYIIRHGQTDFNLKNIVQGSGVDSSLNDFGRAQSLAFFEAYRHVPFDKVYTSALKRSIESVDMFLKAGIPHEKLAGLNEISWGRKEGQPITPEEDAYYHYVLDQWRKGNTSLRIEGGESPEDVVARMMPAVEHIFNRPDEKTILICMHGRAMRILLCLLLNYPLRSMDMFEHENLCLYELNYTGSLFTVEKYNDTRHLIRLKSGLKTVY